MSVGVQGITSDTGALRGTQPALLVKKRDGSSVEFEASRIERAIEKGGLVDLGKAHMLLGISYYGDGRAESASAAFREARTHESTRDEAEVWLEHIARQSQEG